MTVRHTKRSAAPAPPLRCTLGDIVELNSGGSPMTVVGISTPGRNTDVPGTSDVVVWWRAKTSLRRLADRSPRFAPRREAAAADTSEVTPICRGSSSADRQAAGARRYAAARRARQPDVGTTAPAMLRHSSPARRRHGHRGRGRRGSGLADTSPAVACPESGTRAGLRRRRCPSRARNVRAARDRPSGDHTALGAGSSRVAS